MGIFRRPRESSSAPLSPAIAEFWEWWPQVRPEVEAALESGEEGPEVFTRIAERLHRIHEELEWELGRSEESPILTVTGGGDPELRGLAERWLRNAPRGDGWVYQAARQAEPGMLGMRLELGDHEFDLGYVRVGMRADNARARVHVTVYHPDFLFVSEEVQAQVAMHVLVWALGEDDVARWVGELKIAAEEPMDALPPTMLAAVVEQISEQFTEPAWLSGEGRTPRGHPSQLRVRFPVHRQDYPLCDLHVEVSLPYAQSNPDRLPVGKSATALRDFEKRLSRLGDRAILVIRVTGDGTRAFHFYADPDSGVVGELDQLAAGWGEGKARVSATPDPGWRALSPYRP